MTIHLRPGRIDDEYSLLGLFDDAVLWLTERGLGGQWGSQPWSEQPETRERVASLAGSSGTTVAEFENGVVGALEVNEVSPSYAPVTNEPGLYVDLLLTSRRFIGKGIGTAVRGHEKVPGYGHLRSPLVATKVPAFGHEKSPPLTEVST